MRYYYHTSDVTPNDEHYYRLDDIKDVRIYPATLVEDALYENVPNIPLAPIKDVYASDSFVECDDMAEARRALLEQLNFDVFARRNV